MSSQRLSQEAKRLISIGFAVTVGVIVALQAAKSTGILAISGAQSGLCHPASVAPVWHRGAANFGAGCDVDQAFVDSFDEQPDIDLAPFFALQEQLNSALLQLDISEGHSGQIPAQQQLYAKYARSKCVKRISEIGFNAGHSALLWLWANPDATLLSFDLGVHTYTKTALAFVNATFPGRIKVVLGDSTVAIPRYARTHPEAGCDLCIVDGGHAYSVAAADIRNMGIALSGGRRSLMLVDDYGYGVNRPQVNVAVDDLVLFGEFQLLKVWRALPPAGDENRGVAVGVYTR